jgi:hypothetical protein
MKFRRLMLKMLTTLTIGTALTSNWCRAERLDPTAHWAYQPLRATPVPSVPATDWPLTDVDRFALAAMAAHGLQPAPDAAPDVLCRRVYFTLTGLPPAATSAQRFLAAAATTSLDEALAALVDELLATPQYGEKWAQHWMDLVHYADGKGAEYDYFIEGAWRYRDYLVRAFNSDLPYDQFIKEHLIGDLLPPRLSNHTNEALLATSWWHFGEAVNSPVDVANDEAERMEGTIDTLGKAFQGLTLSCARCHDHKFDPISTRDYYALYGIIASSHPRRAWTNEAALQAAATPLQQSRDAFDSRQAPASPIPLPALPNRDAVRVSVLGDFAASLPENWVAKGTTELVTVNDAATRNAYPGLWSGRLSRKLPAWVRSPAIILDHPFIDVLATGEDSMIQLVIDNYIIIKNPLYGGLKQEIKSPGKWRWHRFHVDRWKGQRCVIELYSGKTHTDHNLLTVEDTAKSQFGLRAVWLTDGPSWPDPAWPDLPAHPRWPGDAALEKNLPSPERFLGISETEGWDIPVMNRGDANKPTPQKVPRRYLEYFPALQHPVDTGTGRRQLAESILEKENPFTWRVYVNRLWQHVFGRGLVPTTDNFGMLGKPPSHPELLDYLALQFRNKHHLQTKSALREMLLSRLWRQAVLPAPNMDLDNIYLSVAPLRRLDAESIRDSILAASGDLDSAIGGAPVPVPHRIDAEMKPESGPVDGHRRRSIYLERRRNFPQRFLSIFDRPAPQATVGTRDVTNVPAQSLALLNDPFVLEESQRWADRIAKAPGSVEQRLAEMHHSALARPATGEELTGLKQLLGEAPTAESWALVALSLFNQKEFIYVR